ncbi:hypothetical protein V8C34DRAFT_293311 [Trichoderma compactum]
MRARKSHTDAGGHSSPSCVYCRPKGLHCLSPLVQGRLPAAASRQNPRLSHHRAVLQCLSLFFGFQAGRPIADPCVMPTNSAGRAHPWDQYWQASLSRFFCPARLRYL